MRRFVLALATIGWSVAIAAPSANAAGKGSGAAQGGSNAAHGSANSTAGAPAGPGFGESPSSALTSTPTIQPSVGDDQLNLRRTILRLPF
jgi:hypothetical protein